MAAIINDAKILIEGTLEDVKAVIDKLLHDQASTMNDPEIRIRVIRNGAVGDPKAKVAGLPGA